MWKIIHIIIKMQHNKTHVLQQYDKIIPVITTNKIEILIEKITILLKNNI